MKKSLFIIPILLVLLLTGCKGKENNIREENTNPQQVEEIEKINQLTTTTDDFEITVEGDIVHFKNEISTFNPRIMGFSGRVISVLAKRLEGDTRSELVLLLNNEGRVYYGKYNISTSYSINEFMRVTKLDINGRVVEMKHIDDGGIVLRTRGKSYKIDDFDTMKLVEYVEVVETPLPAEETVEVEEKEAQTQEIDSKEEETNPNELLETVSEEVE